MPPDEMGSRQKPQPPAVATRAVLIAIGGFLGFVALTMAGSYIYLRSTTPGMFDAAARRSFPQPALQTDPRADLAAFNARQQQALTGYGWVDRDAGIVRIPIDDAMAVIAARGNRAYDPPDGAGR